MTAVTIPAELVRDVAARPDAYRPAVEDGAPVLLLAGESAGHEGRAGGLIWAGDDPEPHSLALGGVARWGTAWALVGSVDGGPRPDVGDRVLVLECAPGACQAGDHAGSIARVASGDATKLPDVDVLDHRGQWVSACLPNRWAILPPAPDAEPPYVPRPLTARCQLHDTPHEPATKLVVLDVATQDGDRRRELFVCDACAERYATPASGEGATVSTDAPGTSDPAETVSPNPLRNADEPRRELCGKSVLDSTCGLYVGHGGLCGRWNSNGTFSYPDAGWPSDAEPRPWRVGLSWGRTIVESGTGTPDEQGRRRDDRLVGMVREEADAARIVDAVNAWQPDPELTRADLDALRDRPLPPVLADAGVDELRDHIRFLEWQRERRSSGITRSQLLAVRLGRDEALAAVERLQAQVERYRDRLEQPCGECHDCTTEAGKLREALTTIAENETGSAVYLRDTAREALGGTP